MVLGIWIWSSCLYSKHSYSLCHLPTFHSLIFTVRIHLTRKQVGIQNDFLANGIWVNSLKTYILLIPLEQLWWLIFIVNLNRLHISEHVCEGRPMLNMSSILWWSEVQNELKGGLKWRNQLSTRIHLSVFWLQLEWRRCLTLLILQLELLLFLRPAHHDWQYPFLNYQPWWLLS